MRHTCLVCSTVTEDHDPTCCESHRQTLGRMKKILDHHAEKRDPVSGADQIFLKGWYAAVESIRGQIEQGCTSMCKEDHLE